MKIILRNNLRIPIIGVTIGNLHPSLFDCLIDTGFSGSLAGFVYTAKLGLKQFSIKNVDFIAPPVLLPEENWTVLANGNKVETTEWHNLEMWDGLAKVAEKYLISIFLFFMTFFNASGFVGNPSLTISLICEPLERSLLIMSLSVKNAAAI